MGSVSPRRPPAPRAWDPALPLPISAQRALPAAVLRVLRINVRVFRRCLLRPASHQPVIITPRWLCLVPAPRRWRRGAKPWPRRRRGPLPCVAGRSASFPRRPEGGPGRGCRSSSPPTPWGPWGRPRPLAACTCAPSRARPARVPGPRRRHSEAVAASAARGSATRWSTVRSPSGFSFVSGPSWGLGAKKPGAVVAPESWILAPHCSGLRSDSG